MFGYPSWGPGRLAMLLSLTLTLPAWSADPLAQKPAASVPPWQRLLGGEEARRAKVLQEQVDKHWEAAEFEQALKPAQELTALRRQVQGHDHWEATDAHWQVQALGRLLKQERTQQKEMAQVPARRRQADALEAKGRAREALPLRQQILDVCRQLLTDENPDTVSSYNNLAANQNAQGKYAEAWLADADASEQRLDGLARADQMKDYGFLHLATHGALDARDLLQARLILSKADLPDPDEQMKKGEPIYDGNLSAAEALLSWKLNAELVTLSACETALGKYEVGESYLGFPQALLLAGSRSVCVSLWKVHDTATALLMTRFYQNLLGAREGLQEPLPKARALQEAQAWLKGLSRAEALRLAAAATDGVARGKRPPLRPTPAGEKAEVGDGTDRPYVHPYYWSGFILIGDPS